MNYPQIKPTLNLDFSNTKTLDPRINFRRGTPGAYYDGKTYAKAEENLIEYSEDFSNAYWNTLETSVAEDAETAPDGNITADKIITSTNSSDFHTVRLFNRKPNLIAGKTYTFSCFLKKGEYDFAGLQVYEQNGNRTSDFHFDLNNGVHLKTTHAIYGSTSGLYVSNVDILSVGNDWYRCIITTTPDLSGDYQFRIFVRNDSVDPFAAFAGDGTSGIYAWGAQLEQRDTVTAYTSTMLEDGTSAPITKYQPQLMFASPDQPRFDHDPLTGESKGLLIEESRTNLIEYSEDFYLSPWLKNQNDSNFKYLFVEENSTVSPDGKVDASKVYITQGMPSTGAGFIEIVFTLADNTIYNASIYAKKAEYKMLSFQFNTKDSTYSSISVDLNDGVILSSTDVVGSSIENVGNEWYRVGFSFDSKSGGTTPRMIMQVRDDNNDANLQTNNGIYIWGAQLEAGAFPTSYIKTSGASATRSADNASITGENFSSWYRQDEGSIYVDSTKGNLGTNFAGYFSLHTEDFSNSEYYWLLHNSSDQFQFLVAPAIASLTDGVDVSLGSQKACVSWADDDFSMSINGGAIQSDTSGPAKKNLAGLRIGFSPYSNSHYLNSTIKKLSYYPQRLTNEQLQQLTK